MTPKSLSEEMEQDATTSKRRKAMLWQKLGEGKDPEFKKQYFLTNNAGFYWTGHLLSIIDNEEGKKYLFKLSTQEKPADDITHFCIPVQP
jgi:hypothetical protein